MPVITSAPPAGLARLSHELIVAASEFLLPASPLRQMSAQPPVSAHYRFLYSLDSREQNSLE